MKFIFAVITAVLIGAGVARADQYKPICADVVDELTDALAKYVSRVCNQKDSIVKIARAYDKYYSVVNIRALTEDQVKTLNMAFILVLTNNEADCAFVTNSYRNKCGLKSLIICPRLVIASRNHALDMTKSNYFSHNGRNGSSPFSRARNAGTTATAENIAMGTPGYFNGSDAANLLIKSPGHRQNILAQNYRIGVGGVGVKYVQMFGR